MEQTLTAMQVFDQNNGEVTKSYYAYLNQKGHAGQLAVALFRAQKRSTAAKNYRRGRFTRDAYSVKNWSLSEVCRILYECDHGIPWGWKHDPKTPGYEWVLYVDLPTGQCSFHSNTRICDKDFESEWDGQGCSTERILAFCDMVERGDFC